MKDQKILRVLSLGLGVQSSAIALLCEAGKLPKPDVAIFADTGDEPHAVIAYRDYLSGKLSFPIVTVSKGESLSRHILDAISNRETRCSNPPFFTKGDSGKSEGMLRRKCTGDFKLAPLRREVRRLFLQGGYSKVHQMIGISTDEASRMRDSDVKYIENQYPLIDLGWSRQDCLAWLKASGHPQPAKSACVYCPYTNDTRWQDMRDKDPESFRRAVEFDSALRSTGRLCGVEREVFIHRSCVPLSEVVFKAYDPRKSDIDFGEECEGMCGV